MAKIWQASTKLIKINPLVEEFCCGEDILWEQKLIPYDIQGSVAHAQMLKKIGILSAGELEKIIWGLNEIFKSYQNGSFKLKVADEDCQSAIEAELIKLVGEPGKKLHTGRSRNDQVLTDLKLFIKDGIEEVDEAAQGLIKTFMAFGNKYGQVPMPGYTHMQKAMPSSVKLWAQNFGFMLQEDLKLLKAAEEIINQNPLGSGAAYGVSLPLDRKLTAKLLGFAKVQENVLTCQNMRGKNELYVLQALSQIMMTVSKFAQDVLVFTTSEFDFFTVEEALTTGSSIMPQKKNMDIAELLVSKAQVVVGLSNTVAGICTGLPSGFNRQVQETKGPLFQGINNTVLSLKVGKVLMEGMKPKVDKLKAAMTPELYLTDKAYGLVKQGVAFRDAYKRVKEEYEKSI